VSAHRGRLLAGCILHLDRAYSSGHWWVDLTQAPALTMGLDGLILRVLHPVSDVVAPPRGVWLRRAEPCGWIRRGHDSVPLLAPVAGEVTDVNAHYLEMLSGWSGLGAGEDWLVKVDAHEDAASAAGLSRGPEALGRLLANLRVLQHALREAVGQPGERAVGIALADGGEPNLDLEAVLGHARFETLVDALFHTRP
jgi:glycine cleavage system H lipoate-binding protein